MRADCPSTGAWRRGPSEPQTLSPEPRALTPSPKPWALNQEMPLADADRLPELAISFYGNFTMQSLLVAAAQLRRFVSELRDQVRLQGFRCTKPLKLQPAAGVRVRSPHRWDFRAWTGFKARVKGSGARYTTPLTPCSIPGPRAVLGASRAAHVPCATGRAWARANGWAWARANGRAWARARAHERVPRGWNGMTWNGSDGPGPRSQCFAR